MHGGRIEWFLDMEAYQLNGKYWPKEIAIVNRDSSICHNFHIWDPRRLKNLAKGLTAQHQYKRHNLRWEFGEWKLFDVKTDTIDYFPSTSRHQRRRKMSLI